MTLSGGLSRPGERDRPIIKFTEIDWTLCLVLALIAGAGALMLFSIAGGSWEPWADKHLLRFGIYFILMIALALVDLRVWFSLAYPIYGVGLLLLVAVALVGDSSLGAQRWLALGPVRFQPSEIMKGDEERIREGGCEAYISKPISVSHFLDTITRLLER